MREQNHVGLETRDGVDVGRDPREKFGEAVGQDEHRHIPPVPIRTRKFHRTGAEGCCRPKHPLCLRLCAVAVPDGHILWRGPVRDTRRELVRQLGEKLYGRRPAQNEARHD
jgi:hypothetical protein